MSAIVETTFMLVAVLGIGVSAAAYFLAVTLYRGFHSTGEVSVFLEELRLEPIVETQQVGKNEYLAVTLRARADSDCRNRDSFADSTGELGWNQLEHQREGACILERACLVDHALRLHLFPALHAHSASAD